MIFDTSAVIALLKDEAGADVVLGYLPQAVFSSVNLSESATVLMRGGMPLEEAASMLSNTFRHVVPFDGEQAYIAASLTRQAQEHGISLGDRACLALGLQLKMPVLTSDAKWKKAKTGAEIVLFR